MSEQSLGKHEGFEIVIDLSRIPLKPTGKRETQQLEAALIIGTLYRPEIMELLKDPIEKATWVDSLAIAAGALARSKSGMPVAQIAEELGRSETTIRAHLSGKTKAGKLVIETYERMKNGQLMLSIPFARELKVEDEKVKKLEQELAEARERCSKLEAQLGEMEKAMTDLKMKLEDKERAIQALREENSSLLTENNELKLKLEKAGQIISDIKRLLESSGF